MSGSIEPKPRRPEMTDFLEPGRSDLNGIEKAMGTYNEP